VGGSESLHWIFKEPVVLGAHLDVAGGARPSLSRQLCRAKVVTLVVTCPHVVDVTGADMDHAAALALRLQERSTWVVGLMLERWRQALSETECSMTTRYCNGSLQPQDGDPFPPLSLSPDFKNCTGPLLDMGDASVVVSNETHGKVLYKMLVKVLNKEKLNRRGDRRPILV